MAHYAVLYDTSTGDIVSMTPPPVQNIALESGTGTIVGQFLSGIALGSTSQQDVEWIRVEGFKKFVILRWLSSTEAELSNSAKKFQGSRPYELMKEEAAVQFTTQEKDALIADMQAQMPSITVGGILITTDIRINSRDFFVDIADGNKVKKKVVEIVPE
jgi:hypothetical protein